MSEEISIGGEPIKSLW